jgi:DNA modification methylase
MFMEFAKAFTVGTVQVVQEDCIDGMKKIRDASVDLVITSPPYNIGLKSRNDRDESYDDDLEENVYRELIRDTIIQFHRILKPNGSAWINMKSRWMNEKGEVTGPLEGSLEPPTWILEYTRGKLFLKNEIVWNYDIGSDTQNGKFHPRHESFFWFVKDPRNYKFYIDRIRVQNKTGDPRNNPNGANPTDVWYFPIVKGNAKQRNSHPAQFPEKMIERIVLACSDEGDMIIDPFLGSGTTLKVASQNSRKGIGFEIKETYAMNALERIKESKKNVTTTL